jgi:hypothetical protein
MGGDGDVKEGIFLSFNIRGLRVEPAIKAHNFEVEASYH